MKNWTDIDARVVLILMTKAMPQNYLRELLILIYIHRF